MNLKSTAPSSALKSGLCLDVRPGLHTNVDDRHVELWFVISRTGSSPVLSESALSAHGGLGCSDRQMLILEEYWTTEQNPAEDRRVEAEHLKEAVPPLVAEIIPRLCGISE